LPHENKFLAARQTTTLAAYYLRMSSFLCKTAVAPTCLSVCLLAPALLRTAHAQVASTPESRIEHAKTLYYTPTNSGLNSFHCDVTVDWKDLLARFGVPNLHDSDPRLTYLNAIKLSLDDNLTGTGALNWFAPSGSASDPDDGIAKIRGGMQQMVSGFFQSWNPFLNGTYIPNFDATTTAKPEGDGIVVQSGDASALVVEHFNKSLLLTGNARHHSRRRRAGQSHLPRDSPRAHHLDAQIRSPPAPCRPSRNGHHGEHIRPSRQLPDSLRPHLYRRSSGRLRLQTLRLPGEYPAPNAKAMN
jgi:hypothetical protein